MVECVTVDLDALRLVLDYVNACECRGPFGEAMDDAMDRLEAALKFDGPIGSTAEEASTRRAERSPEFRARCAERAAALIDGGVRK